MFGFKLFKRSPVAAPAQTVPPGEPSVRENKIPSKPGKRVLIVDDDQVILETTTRKLKAAGYNVYTVSEGSEAIAAVEQHKPEIILLDIHFPPDIANGGRNTWDGFQLMSWLRGLSGTQNTRFILISSDDPATLKRNRLAASVAVFQKPLDYKRLLAAMAGESDKATPGPGQQFEIIA
jgi:two-component system OmpR family response regulator